MDFSSAGTETSGSMLQVRGSTYHKLASVAAYKRKDKILVGYNAYNDKTLEENTINEKPILFKNNSRIETY